MNKIRLHDGCFDHEKSATLSGDNSGRGPQFIEWCREEPCESLFTWYTDTNLHKAAFDFAPERIAWLIEPPSLSDTHYKYAYKHRQGFRAIFTFVDFFVQMGSPYKFFPLGGSWIHLDQWGMHEKLENMSIIASMKKDSTGQALRHNIAKEFPSIEAFGTAYHQVDSKLEALAPFRYSIVVESWRGNSYFSEKLIDCLCVGTIPIYWGCPNIGKFFDEAGIITFEYMSDLNDIIDFVIGKKDYEWRRAAIEHNIEIAKSYRCAEDWLFLNGGREFLK